MGLRPALSQAGEHLHTAIDREVHARASPDQLTKSAVLQNEKAGTDYLYRQQEH